MKLKKDKSVLQDYFQATRHEWLETNGLGGWAGSSIIGCNTRRYHGLLVAATQPPAERMNLVSKLDERLIVNGESFELATNNYGDAIYPKGYLYLESFSKKLFPEWIYEVNGIRLKKTIAMVHGENTTLIIYDVLKAGAEFTMELLPLISAKGYHSLQHFYNNIWWDVQFENGIFKNQPHENAPAIFIAVPGASYRHHPAWFNKFNYSVELYRGQDYEEDLFNHGTLSVQLKEGDTLGILISTEDPANKNAHNLIARESMRRESLLKDQPDDETVHQLTLAADQFVVKRGENLKTIIAGYHWFTDWGRDTMISLPGLCLSTGRPQDAKKILSAFAGSISMGMLPNRFQDNGEAPEYNNVDGTLWYFIAVYKYFQATFDKQFVLKEILPVLKDILDWHHKGTRFHIHDTEDGLLYSGEAGVQLTWMDAKIGDWVVTPRTGKAVEVNALWYNALCIYAALLELNQQPDLSNKIKHRAANTKQHFNQLFWNADKKYLYDVIDGNLMDDTFRPNQIFAISLPFPLVDENKAQLILKAITERLYTPVGLRSLPADHANYIGIYGGNAIHRDSSYHQGTVWSWLLGAYVDAIMRFEKGGAKAKAKKIMDNFKYHLNEGCMGSVAEIFDANPPHTPRGCVAQAWGVAEWLRVIIDYELHNDSGSVSHGSTMFEMKTRKTFGSYAGF